ncbi:uncharacterized protein [Dysidea avara]|uniref:uncharacterized protein n=1 Tax=Dysidea avara TaxID=196820 RepID=UPI003324C3E2
MSSKLNMMPILYLTALALLSLALLSLPTLAIAENGTCTRYGFDVEFPGVSCADIYDKNPASHGKSGYYVIGTDHVRTVYCDMELECSGHKGGWMKIADYDTSKGDDCPSGWKKIKINGLDLCRSPNDNAGCYSTHFHVNKVSYNKICGRVKGYQKGSPTAFERVSNPSLDNGYVEGISITLGSPRKHVWTYAVGLSDDHNYPVYNCPCAKYPGPSPPAFVGNHYYCESGDTGAFSNSPYYTTDPLWDGDGCLPDNNCCTNTDQPWFFRQITMARKDDIEVRLCTNEVFSNEATLVEQIEIYVQ